MKQDHWLARPGTIRLLWVVGVAVCALTVFADAFVTHHPHFGLEGTFGFAAWYGFIGAVGMVIAAKLFSVFVKRKDTYYAD